MRSWPFSRGRPTTPLRPLSACRRSSSSTMRTGRRADTSLSRIGVGVNTGKLMLGTVGEHERMDGSVIADAVNLCSRVQSLTRVYGSHHPDHRADPEGPVGSAADSPFGSSTGCACAGNARPSSSSRSLTGRARSWAGRRVAYKEELSHALRLYFGRRFEESLQIVTKLREKNPDDRILRIYQRRCENLVALGAPAEWQGIEEIEIH